MGRHRKNKSRHQKAAVYERREYVLPVKENEVFEEYYKGQGIVPEAEMADFLATMREPLPATFRITGGRSEAKQILQMIRSQYFSDITNIQVEGRTIEPPKCLQWYPNELAWQLNFDRNFIRQCTPLKKLHTFLVSETESGTISRQEAVSMIPPLVLDIQPHHMVFDMCAAPGSKTAQLIELIHQSDTRDNPVPGGLVVANDADNKRCYLMMHQIKRLASPCFVITNHDASSIPNFHLSENDSRDVLKFDRVLADVPCSGDGTMRKNPDVWSKWNPAIAWNLHGIQKRILKRGVQLLAVGGRIVYSTCSLNPVEDEAVIVSILKECEGALELADLSSFLPGLQFTPGRSSWKMMTKSGDWYENWSEVPESLHTQMRPSMFPPSPEESASMNLNRCMRVLPHHQNTGGFFIAALTKVREVPWINPNKRAKKAKADTKEQKDENAGDKVEEKETGTESAEGTREEKEIDESKGKTAEATEKEKSEDNGNVEMEEEKVEEKETGTESAEGTREDVQKETDESDGKAEEATDKGKSADNGNVEMEEDKETGGESNEDGQRKGKRKERDEDLNHPVQKKKIRGFKEDPFVFFSPDEPIMTDIKKFFHLSDEFPVDQLLVRSHEGKKRNIYYMSKNVKQIVKCNEGRIKFINGGLKLFARSESAHTRCDFRLVQDGVNCLLPFMGPEKKVMINLDDMLTILCQENPYLSKLSDSARERFESIEQGGFYFEFNPDGREEGPQCQLTLCGWLGKTSCRAFLPRHDREHYLRLCGQELKTKEEALAEKAERKRKKEEESKEGDEAAALTGETDGQSEKTEESNQSDEIDSSKDAEITQESNQGGKDTSEVTQDNKSMDTDASIEKPSSSINEKTNLNTDT